MRTTAFTRMTPLVAASMIWAPNGGKEGCMSILETNVIDLIGVVRAKSPAPIVV